jgi:hypothetical protein
MMIHAARHATEIAIHNIMMVPVEAQARFDLVEIRGDGVALIAGDAEDVGEAAAAGETTRCYLVELGAWCWGCGVVEAVPFCAADGKDVWTGAGEIDFEDYFGSWGQQGFLMRGGWRREFVSGGAKEGESC